MEAGGCCAGCESWQETDGSACEGPCVRAAELLASYQLEISFILKEEFCFAKISVQCDQEQIYLVSTYLQLTILN